MKNTKIILLTIGTLGVVASIYGTITGMDFSTNMIGYICGSSLILGYYDLKKKENKNACE